MMVHGLLSLNWRSLSTATQVTNVAKLPSSVEEGMPRPQALAGVVRPVRVPTTLRWLVPAPPLLV